MAYIDTAANSGKWLVYITLSLTSLVAFVLLILAAPALALVFLGASLLAGTWWRWQLDNE